MRRLPLCRHLWKAYCLSEGVDENTGEEIPIDAVPSLREADDPFRAAIVRWVALDVPSIMVEEDLMKLREAYRIPADIELILMGPNERACFPRRGCTALHLNAFVSGIRLPLHPMLRRILRAYDLAPTQVVPNGWSQMVGACICGFGTLLACCPSSITQWKESWFWVSNNWQRVFDDPEPDLDVSSVYGIAKDTSQRNVIEDLSRERNREAVEASKVIEVDDALEGEVPLSRKRKARASGTETSQAKKNAVEVVDNYAVCGALPFQRMLAVNISGEVVLEGPSKSTQAPGRRG
ncbi:Uncharacterized protein Adt_20855 [Abeliophyllum distichum]|uniref:Transposase (putative) gypsy type domain-containing protein n=1 Tax=Abeliophyllum distichum TaxID=126358 RepID=A0ABD1SXS0_9LAMI